MKIIENNEFIELIEGKIKCNVRKLKPGYYEVREVGTTGGAMLTFVITNWFYGGPNYIIIKEEWQGPCDHGNCVVETVVSDQFQLNRKLKTLLENGNLKLYRL